MKARIFKDGNWRTYTVCEEVKSPLYPQGTLYLLNYTHRYPERCFVVTSGECQILDR